MPAVNKKSIRDEVARLQSEMDRLSDKEGAINAEVKILMQSMFLVINLMLSIFLEKMTKKNSRNSSIPPSQTETDNSSLPKNGSKGKGKNEDDHRAANTRTRKTTVTVEVHTCDVCGEDLDDVPCAHHERRTKIDIIFEKLVEHTDAEVKQCPGCDAMVKGEFPKDLHGPLQYGDGLKAFMINLLFSQMIAMARAQKLMKSMIGKVIAEASVLKWIRRLHEALALWEQSAIEALLNSKAIHVDETSLKASKDRHWIHVYASGDITLKFLHRRRGLEAINAINIIPRYGGNIIHDCWSSYLSYLHCGHALCGSHLLRELTFIIESNDYQWAKDMKALLKNACHTVNRRKRKKLMKKEFAALKLAYGEIISHGEKELPPIPEKPPGRRGKMAKSDAHNLWERMKVHETAVLLFAEDAHVAFTNNRAERDLRMSKVKQKVSGCFRTTFYAKAYCRISSYLQTMANKGYNPLVAIQLAFAGYAPLEGGE